MGSNAVVKVIDRVSGKVLWSVRTRRDFTSMFGEPPQSRYQDSNYWKVIDPAGVNSLYEFDVLVTFIRGVRIVLRFEILPGGNAKQRRKARRACKK